jgi:hypothetical protein
MAAPSITQDRTGSAATASTASGKRSAKVVTVPRYQADTAALATRQDAKAVVPCWTKR